MRSRRHYKTFVEQFKSLRAKFEKPPKNFCVYAGTYKTTHLCASRWYMVIKVVQRNRYITRSAL